MTRCCAGAYRVEVRVEGWNVPWILSNPIYVYGRARRSCARRAAWPPAEAPAPLPAQPLDAFGKGSPLAAESDAGTWVDAAVRVASERTPGAAAARLRFCLTRPRPAPAEAEQVAAVYRDVVSAKSCTKS